MTGKEHFHTHSIFYKKVLLQNCGIIPKSFRPQKEKEKYMPLSISSVNSYINYQQPTRYNGEIKSKSNLNTHVLLSYVTIYLSDCVKMCKSTE